MTIGGQNAARPLRPFRMRGENLLGEKGADNVAGAACSAKRHRAQLIDLRAKFPNWQEVRFCGRC